MSDRNQPHANGRIAPAEQSAGDLAAWWDRRVERHRVGATEPTREEPAPAVVARIEALSRADDLSRPRPGFLDHLESQLMQIPIATLPVATPVAEGEPSGQSVPHLAPPRRGRGLIDVLSVAAVVALLLGGSFAVWHDRSAAPRPDGTNGVAGVATSDHRATPEASGVDTVALDQSWVDNLAPGELTDIAPVNTSDCTTPSRPAGSVEALLEERLALGEAAPTIEPEFVPGANGDTASYPAASEQDVAAVTSFFREVSACRFATGDREGTALLPYTGAYWNLYSDDFFSAIFPVEAFTNENPVAQSSSRPVSRVIQERYDSYVSGWSYPAKVLDVRRVPTDVQGRSRLLVSTTGSSELVFDQLSLLVKEDGQWRFVFPSLRPPEPPYTTVAQVVDVLIGQDQYGPRGSFSSRLEADRPVAMTLANVGATPQRVSIAGQDIGVIQPGASLVLQPFRVRPDAVVGAGGRFTFTVESVDPAAANAPTPRSLTIAVYPAGSLGPGGGFVGTATPAAAGTPVAAG